MSGRLSGNTGLDRCSQHKDLCSSSKSQAGPEFTSLLNQGGKQQLPTLIHIRSPLFPLLSQQPGPQKPGAKVTSDYKTTVRWFK